MFARIRKALWAGIGSGLWTVGIDVSQLGNVEWWQPIAVAFLTGFVTYWVPANTPGTLTRSAPSGTDTRPAVEDGND